MSIPNKEVIWALTEKEKQTLRLIVRGHDAKSVARTLGLSVHTINERLRDARRKMAVSSSREAARLLLEAEDERAALPDPDLFGDATIGEDTTQAPADRKITPIDGAGRSYRLPQIIAGAIIMTLAVGLLLFTALPHIATAPETASNPLSTTVNAEVVDTARSWLALLDGARWDESYLKTGTSFQKLNTVQAWTAASEDSRTPLGAILSRKFVSQESLPVPPHGYEMVKFRTRFANRADALETVTLDRESGSWRVVGVTIE